MLVEIDAAGFLLVCLGFLFTINVHTILVVRQSFRAARSNAELDRSSDLVIGSAILGTKVCFVQARTYPLFVLSNSISLNVFGFYSSSTAAACALEYRRKANRFLSNLKTQYADEQRD